MERTRNLLPWTMTAKQRALVDRNLTDRSRGEAAATMYLNGHTHLLTIPNEVIVGIALAIGVGCLLTAIKVCGG